MLTADYAGLTFQGNQAIFSKDAYKGPVTITATIEAPNYPKFSVKKKATAIPTISRQIVVYVDKQETTGVNDVNMAKDVKNVRFYNLNGAQMREANGACIKVIEYTDGTRQAVKVIK